MADFLSLRSGILDSEGYQLLEDEDDRSAGYATKHNAGNLGSLIKKLQGGGGGSRVRKI